MIPEIFDSQIIHSLGMTLLHCLWQIPAIYILLRIVLSLLKGSDSKAKYNLSVLSIFMVLFFGILTFYLYQNEKQGSENLVFYHLVQENPGGMEKVLSYPVPESVDKAPENKMAAADYLPWFVIAYITGLLILSLKLISSILYLNRYKTRGKIAISPGLEDLFNQLTGKIKVRKTISIIESVLTRVPFVVGYFKPVVVVPAGLFMHLPFNQVEAILAHELAHIKRNDFLVNILQSIIELLFFFHPFIYLISKKVKDERENCCDDIALLYCSDTASYAKALANMEIVKGQPSLQAVAFVKRKKNLLERVKRILKPNHMKTKLSDRIFAGLIIILGLSTILITGAAALNNYPDESLVPGGNTSINLESLYGGQQVADSIIQFDDGRIISQHKNEKGKTEEFDMVFVEGELVELYIDDKEIPKEEYAFYKDVIKATLEEVRKAQAEVEKAKTELAEIDEEAIRAEVDAAMAEVKNIDHEAIMNDVRKALEEVNMEMTNINMEEIRAEIEAAMKEADIEIEAARIEAEAELAAIDWEAIRAEIDASMKNSEIEVNTGLSGEEVEKIVAEAMKSMEEIDWNAIHESVRVGLEAAKISLEGLDGIIESSVGLGLGIAGEVLENLDVTILNALKSVENLDTGSIMNEIDTARMNVEEDSRKLDELERNMEKALDSLEKKK